MGGINHQKWGGKNGIVLPTLPASLSNIPMKPGQIIELITMWGPVYDS